MPALPELLFEDADVVVVNKPAGITVIPERIHTDHKSLKNLLEATYGKLFTVHRLDRDTSGVILFAKHEVAHRSLSRQFENRMTQKFYYAIVQGRVAAKSGIINSPILENPARPGTMMVHPRGKEALTHFEVIEQFRHAALLQVEIKTGRTHQIRVHLALSGHPLIVDTVYAQREFFLLSSVKKNYKSTDETERPTLSRLSLHAAKLIFTSPTTHQSISVEAPLPKDLATVLKLLRKYDAQ